MDSRLRLFDSDGNEIDNSDDNISPGESPSSDPYLAFTPESAGSYFVGVSFFDNFAYNPFDAGQTNDFIEGENGSYELEISFADENSGENPDPDFDLDPDNTIGEAISTGLDNAGETATFTDNLIPNSDVDIYQVQLEAGEALVVNRSLAANIIYRVFDESGNVAEGEFITSQAVSDNFSGGRFQGDSALSFIPEASGNYYLGVSSFDNDAYNSLDGSGVENGLLFSNDYSIDVEAIAIAGDSDPDNTISEAI